LFSSPYGSKVISILTVGGTRVINLETQTLVWLKFRMSTERKGLMKQV